MMDAMGLAEKVNKFNQQAMKHLESQSLNPFSDRFSRSPSPRPKFSKDEYGKPVAGSLTEARGKKAFSHISREILELCECIYDVGKHIRDPELGEQIIVSFGELFSIYSKISDKVVGLLIAAKKRGYVYFEPEILFQRRDDDVLIALIKPLEEIKSIVNGQISASPSPVPAPSKSSSKESSPGPVLLTTSPTAPASQLVTPTVVSPPQPVTEAPQETPADPALPQETPADPALPQETLADPALPQETPSDPALPQETPADPALPQETPADPALPQETPADPALPQETVSDSVPTLQIASDPPVAQGTPSDSVIPQETTSEPELPQETVSDSVLTLKIPLVITQETTCEPQNPQEEPSESVILQETLPESEPLQETSCKPVIPQETPSVPVLPQESPSELPQQTSPDQGSSEDPSPAISSNKELA